MRKAALYIGFPIRLVIFAIISAVLVLFALLDPTVVDGVPALWEEFVMGRQI